MRAGMLNRLVAIESRSVARDALNRPLDVWTVYDAEVWANIRGATGMGVIRGGAEGVSTELNAYSFRIRYRTDVIKTDMRVVFGGRYYNIIDVRHDLAGQDWTDIVCQVPGSV